MATPIPTGGINEVKKRLLALIVAAEPAAHAFGNWRLAQENLYGPKTGAKVPTVTVRISPARIWDAVYSRRIPESGDMAVYTFSAHCFASACTVAGEERAKHAHDVADRIMGYLVKQTWEKSPHDSHQIADVFGMTARESEPKQGSRRNICRVIIEGLMLVKREDG